MTGEDRKKLLAEISFRWKTVDPDKIKISSPKKALEDMLFILSEIKARDETLREIMREVGTSTRAWHLASEALGEG